jgi:hypothetical protein
MDEPCAETEEVEIMTRLLDQAIREVASLPEADQDRIAQLILAELQAEAGWDERFRRSQDKLSQLGNTAQEEIAKRDIVDEDPAVTRRFVHFLHHAPG